MERRMDLCISVKEARELWDDLQVSPPLGVTSINQRPEHHGVGFTTFKTDYGAKVDMTTLIKGDNVIATLYGPPKSIITIAKYILRQ